MYSGASGAPALTAGSAAVHLERAHGGNHHHAVGDQAGVAALDVEELLHANVGAETGFGDHVIGQLEGDLVGDDGAVAVGDIGKGPGVHEGGRAFQGLHQGGHDGVLHQDGHGAGAADIFGGDGLASLAGGDHNIAKALAHIGQVGGQGQDGHDLAGDGDVETGLAGEARFSAGLDRW